MHEGMTLRPKESLTSPRSMATAWHADPGRAFRHNANLKLIRLRLADEHRTARPKRWWQSLTT